MSAQPRISAHVEQAPILKAEKVKPSLLLKLAIDQIRWKTVSRLLNLVYWKIILKHLENTGIPGSGMPVYSSQASQTSYISYLSYNLYRISYVSYKQAIFWYLHFALWSNFVTCELTKSKSFISKNSIFYFFSYKEPIFWQKIPIFFYILNLNSLFFLSDFPKSGWDAWE